MIEIQILLVVETNPVVKSDDAYYSWIMKNFYSGYVSSCGFENIRITFTFVYMDGKTNYDSGYVKKDIDYATSVFSGNKAFVIYCLDMDNKSLENCKFINRVEDYCKRYGYFLSIAYKEIEDVLEAPLGSSKSQRVRLFARQYPGKDSFPKKRFCVSIDNLTCCIGQTNFCSVVDEIIEKAKRFKE